MSGQLEVIVGSMFSGKSEELIRRVRRAKLLNPVYCFKPKMDDRYSEDKIASHANSVFPSQPVMGAAQLMFCMRSKDPPGVVGIDEVQLFDDDILDAISDLLDRGFNVITAGLDTDYMRKPFAITLSLMADADDLVKLKAVCLKCGGKATKTYRKGGTGTDRILIGGAEMYEARCRTCHRLEN